MKTILVRLSVSGAFIFALTTCADSQTKTQPRRQGDSSAATQVVGGTGKAAVIVVRSAAKVGWEVTRFTAVNLAEPAGKTLLLKGVPKATVLLLKTSVVSAKYLLPLAMKLSVL